MKFSIRDFFGKCDQIRRKLPIWSHLLKKSLMENFIFCAMYLANPKIFLCLFTVHISCFLFSNNICSLFFLPTNKQVLQSSNIRLLTTTHFCVPLPRLSSNFLPIFLYAYVFALNATNSEMIFPSSSFLIILTTFLLFPIGSGLLLSFGYPLASNFVFTSFAMSL